jgi:Sperm-tail PG-rich repeat
VIFLVQSVPHEQTDKIMTGNNQQTQPKFSGKDEPKAPSMHIKPKDPKIYVTPAPGAYNPENADRDVKLSAPKYSFGIKPKGDKPVQGPGDFIIFTGNKLECLSAEKNFSLV